MAANPTIHGRNNSDVSLGVIVVILMTISSISDARCRFANKSDTRGSCIFPCRCTKGCNTTTGECLIGGRCIDDHPTGYRWSGSACQIGNIAYNKPATQVSYTWGDQFPAGRAVDGNVDKWRSHEHCALPGRGQGSNAWWQVDLGGMYNVLRVDIYNGNNRCKSGHFGAQCQFQCHCPSGETCDDITGKCPSECLSAGWGVGCMLSNDHYYNDPKGNQYLGKRGSTTHINEASVERRCVLWTAKIYNIHRTFPDGSRVAAKNYCRNMDNEKYAWCYFNTKRNWGTCRLTNIPCVIGRFDVNCVNECHCSNATEDCQRRSGQCQNSCAPHFKGSTCQECELGYYGALCDRPCHCSSGGCGKATGHCPSGCATGWTGVNCETDSRDVAAFTLSVGNSQDRTSHKQCAVHRGDVADGAVVNKSCTAIGRYVSFQRNEGGGHRLTALCEVVVIGHLHISCDYCSSTCNNVIGCGACEPGKQQPDCTKDCVKGYYGVNCAESCGKCKNISQCSVVNGDCDGVCETWYAKRTCKTYIVKPSFESHDKPVVKHITESSVTVTWPNAKNITHDLGGDYYIYIVRIDAEGEAEDITTRHIAHDSDKIQVEQHITGLKFNTNYTVRVQPYRVHNGEQEGGTATEITKFKTNCTAPIVGPVTTSIPLWPTNTSTVVSWKAINESGCDAIMQIQVSYKRQAINETWKDTTLGRVDQTQLTITNLTYDLYDVKLTVTNNMNLSSSTNIVITKLATTTTATTASTTADMSKKEPLFNESVHSLTPGPIVGIAIAVVFVLIGVAIVAFLILRRSSGDRSTGGIPMGIFNRSKKGAGIDTAELDVEEDVGGDDEGDDDVGQVDNPQAIYANMLAESHSVTVSGLAAYFGEKRRRNGFQKEFEEVRSGVYAKYEEANKSHNKGKNRFMNISAYDHTRVVLSTENYNDDYINANHIMLCFMLPGPKDWTIDAMWRMIWQEKTNMIVMLANLYENGKEKCSQYWPEKGKTKTWGHFLLENTGEEQFAEYVVRAFTLKNEAVKKMRKVRQFHFTAWPDKGTPDYAYPVLAFHRKVRSFDSERRGPLVVHCSAGVGRTGTFISIDILMQQAAAEGSIDVFECVNLLRTQRISMVQTLDQYVYIYQALIESSDVTVVSCSQLKDAFDELCRDKKLNKQFQHLNALRPIEKKSHCASLEPNNVGKNRVIDIIPDDMHRTYLTTPCKGGNNYINAVYVHGYKERNAYIIAQSPMTSTVVDMWRLLNDHESHTVIMLDIDADTDDCATYWPKTKGEKRQYGPFEVELIETTDDEDANVTTRQFKLFQAGRSASVSTVVKQFHLKNGWGKAELVPIANTVILNLLDLVEKWQQQSGNGPVTMHCSDGASRCGVLCASSYMLEHMKVEQEVDVFHAVQHVRTTRPELITDLTQYRFLYELALAYMSQFDTYANFQ